MANNINVLDAASLTKTVKTTDNAGVHSPHVDVEFTDVAPSVNSGTKDTGTLRVVLATDQPALTNKLLVTPDSVALPANQSVNAAQINGATPLMGAGNTGTGSLRVTIATDQTQLTNKLLVTPDLPTGASTAAKQPALGTAGTASADVITIQGITSMTKLLVTPDANSAVNVAQINGHTALEGGSNGGQGVGGLAASGATVAGNPLYIGDRAATSLPTAVTNGQAVGAMADVYGRQVIIPQGTRDIVGTQTTTISATTTEAVIGTAVASTFLDLVAVVVSNTSAATATRIDFRDTNAGGVGTGTVIFSLYSPPGQTIGFMPPIPIPQTAVNTNWTATTITSTTDVRVFIQFMKNK